MALDPKRAAIRSISIREITDALAKAPEIWPALRAALLAALDSIISGLPEELRAGLQELRDQIASATTVPISLISDLLHAIKAAVLSGDFGPITHDQADLG